MSEITKADFIVSYRKELVARYEWTADTTKLDKFLGSVVKTLDGANTWDFHGEAVTAAWRSLGGKGKPSLKALRALP